MRLLPGNAPCSRPRPVFSALVATLVTGTLTLAAASPASAATATATAGKYWLAPLDLGPAPANVQKGLVPRVGLTNSGRGTVAWNQAGDGSILSRDFTAGGTVGPLTSPTKGSLVADVARDTAGNVIVTGQSAGSPAISWTATRPKDGGNWLFRTTGSGPYVNAPAAFGLKSGFLVAATSSFTPTTAAAGLPTAAAFGFTTAPGQPVAIGKALEGVETGDFAHGADGSNWALGGDGYAVSTGRRETTKAKDGKAAKSVPALLRLGKTPTRYSILGADRFGAGAVDTVGSAIAVAGLDVQQTAPIAQRGIPVVALGEGDRIEETVEIGGVPDRRALDVDVAGRAGGGAVVTWIQQSTARAENLFGQAKWALVDDAGDVEERGAFTTSKDSHSLRVVRTGSTAFAVWIQGTGTKARWKAAQIDDEGASLVKAPAGNPVGRIEGGLNTSQLTSNGTQVALTFVDATTNMVRVAAQRVK
ncbi:MAG: hypothetical protein J7513_06015 [Solirubrobacteraceae bacterium]|nr:hypothetical protein [Solirubrobacteraceae bacterium]